MENLIKSIVEDIDLTRRNSKNYDNKNGYNWYQYSKTINEKFIKLKGYKTWIQRIEFTKNNITITDSSPMNLNIKKFKEYLTKFLKDCLYDN